MQALGFAPVTKTYEKLLLASGGKDHKVKLWDAKACVLLHMLMHQEAVTSLVFGPERLLATGSKDSIIKLWTPGKMPSAKGQSADEDSAIKAEEIAWNMLRALDIARHNEQVRLPCNMRRRYRHRRHAPRFQSRLPRFRASHPSLPGVTGDCPCFRPGSTSFVQRQRRWQGASECGRPREVSQDPTRRCGQGEPYEGGSAPRDIGQSAFTEPCSCQNYTTAQECLLAHTVSRHERWRLFQRCLTCRACLRWHLNSTRPTRACRFMMRRLEKNKRSHTHWLAKTRCVSRAPRQLAWATCGMSNSRTAHV